jgi:hypothetical protein
MIPVETSDELGLLRCASVQMLTKNNMAYNDLKGCTPSEIRAQQKLIT